MRTPVTRRRRIAGGIAIAGGVILALSGLAIPADAQQPDNPGGNEDCPEGTIEVAKFNRDGESTNYTAEHGGDVVTLSNTTKTSVDWSSTVTISHIVVKGGPGAIVKAVEPPATSGTVDNSGVPEVGQGNTPDISNLKFCAGEGGDDGGDDGGDNGDDGGDNGDDGGDNGTTTDDGGTDGVLPTEVTQPAEVLPQVVEQPAPAPAAPAPAAAPARQLPRTGTETDLALIGLGLLLAGAGFVLYSNPLPAFAGRRK